MAANDIAFHKSFLKIQMKKFRGAKGTPSSSFRVEQLETRLF